MSDLNKVIENGFCIGCGSCQIENNVKTKENDYGMYTIDIEDTGKLNSKVCPFSNNSKNELDISNLLFKNIKDIKYHKHIGYYLGLFAGYVKDINIRSKATSGGITKWIIHQLLLNKMIDGVIHVVRKNNSETLFEYSIGYTKEDIYNGSQSAYYTTNFSEVINKLLNNNDNKKYAFIGVPCYCKAIRLLCSENKVLENKIKYVIGILCGHMKTKNYAKFMAWESKLNPNELSFVNFRKKSDTSASDYIFNAIDINKETNIKRAKLSGGNYNIPHMKYKACDFCEDVFGYCADIVLGDAWLPIYRDDPNGTNIVIVRNTDVYNIINNNNELVIDNLNESQIIQSQSSSYSHRIEDIGFRLFLEKQNNSWVPNKIAEPIKKLKNCNRENIQKLRMEIREKSHEYFLDALKNNDLNEYLNKINILISTLNSYY